MITAAQRLEVLQNHEVDMVARNMTITCDRWKSIAFSAEYYLAGQKILVRKGSDITGLSTRWPGTGSAPRSVRPAWTT